MRHGLVFFFILFNFFTEVSAQSTWAANNTVFGGYLGWDASMGGVPLTIKHETDDPINFHTFAGTGGFANLRMFIEGSSGHVGIGNFATANTLLHLHQWDEEQRVDFQMTDYFTDGTVDDGFEMEYFRKNYFHITHNEYAPLDFYSRGTDGSNYKRFRIFATDTMSIYQKTRVAVMSTNSWDDIIAIPTATPVMPGAMFHIGDVCDPGNMVDGHRTWMDYGTYVAGGTDMMYIGLKNEDLSSPPATFIDDRADAVICWGDNQELSNNVENINDLRFIFTANNTATIGNPKARDYHGLEAARITYDGKMGIGNFFDYLPATRRPARRLEVLDMGLNEPQFRLTYSQAGVASPTPCFTDFMSTSAGDLLINPTVGLASRRRVGINLTTTPNATLEVSRATAPVPHLRLSESNSVWTDIQTMASGDLYIHPSNAGANANVGINTNAPTNTLEINSNVANSSGLTFTDLNASSPFSPANGVALSVNSSGDVILVDDGGSTGVTVCPGGSPTNYLVKYTSATTACSSAVYETTAGNVGLGITTAADAKLDLVVSAGKAFESTSTVASTLGANSLINLIPGSTGANQTNLYVNTEGFSSNGVIVGGDFISHDRSTSTESTIGVRGVASSASTEGRDYHNIIGVAGKGIASLSNQYVKGGEFAAYGNGAEHDGILSFAYGTTGVNRGVYGHAYGAATSNFGLRGYAVNATNNYGASLTASGGANAYGAYINSSGGTNTYGIFVTLPTGTISSTNTAAYFNGDIFGTTANFLVSDSKFKQNVQPLNNATNILSQLNVKTFEFDLRGYSSMNLPLGLQYGLIAQEVEQVIPGMVRNFKHPEMEVNGNLVPEVDFKGVQYETLIPILVAAFQEQKHELDSIKMVLANHIGLPRSQDHSGQTQERISLSNSLGVILHQNDPNPFAESTIIRFSIPEEVLNARILFTDTKGTILKTATIDSRGNGSLEVFASDLSSGLYQYTLVCDGKVIDSKKMIKH